MVYAPRKITFPFFIIVFTIVFLCILYVGFLNRAVDVSSDTKPVVSVAGDKVVLSMTIVNNTKTIVRGVMVEVRSDQYNRSFFLKETEELSFLAPQEKYEFTKELPISKSLKYVVSVSAPFSAPKLLSFEIDAETINPLKAYVDNFPRNPVVGEVYEYLTKICNLSKSNLPEVHWYSGGERGFFKEQDAVTGEFVGRTLSIDSAQCKTFYSTLTPIKAGNLQLVFKWKVGELEKQEIKDVVITVQ
jgi:hypothetical protein